MEPTTAPPDPPMPPPATPGSPGPLPTSAEPLRTPDEIPRWPAVVIRTSTIVAWTAMAAIAAGVVLFLVPVKNEFRGRTIQDCGVPAAYLWDGRSSILVDTSNGVDARTVTHINGHQCSQQVADRAVPAGSLLLGGFVVGLIGFVLAWIGHRAEQRSRWYVAPQ